MKRTLISFVLIVIFILGVVLGDLLFMSNYAEGMNQRLDMILSANTQEEMERYAAELDDFFVRKNFLAHRMIPTGRLEELETLLHKLNAYINTSDIHEIEATVAEIKSRVNLLYSTTLIIGTIRWSFA